ncbi:hypothetical protein ElyMa_005896500 [Elysia marginata]|uniref:Uncharacterized protein n=1 Tax=Elysia marginata TaxID=1093978 RepID=A0AAV4G5A9_9GAST|nr:hypothetical protein ElyMa_005896500 [Elysia marginata]
MSCAATLCVRHTRSSQIAASPPAGLLDLEVTTMRETQRRYPVHSLYWSSRERTEIPAARVPELCWMASAVSSQWSAPVTVRQAVEVSDISSCFYLYSHNQNNGTVSTSRESFKCYCDKLLLLSPS